MKFTGDERSMSIREDAARGNLWLGGDGVDGDLIVFAANATNNEDTTKSTFHVDGDGGNLWLGGNGKDGDIAVFPSDATNNHDLKQSTFHFDGNGGNLWMGGNGRDGDIVLFPGSATDNHDLSQATIHLDADSGDIKLQNADCAEEFEVEVLEASDPGTVMVISDDSRLRVSDQACDHRVAGIVAGAGQYRPGIILGHNKDGKNSLPIALMGRVNCKVDATAEAIKVGDLLTTSSLPGHAMKAVDPLQAFGAVIGKALGNLDDGTGMIPVLVALQ